MSTMKKALVISAFNDSGTGESFEKGATPMIEAGAFANYEAAGLVRAAPAAAKAAAKPKAKAKVKAAPKAAAAQTAAPAPTPAAGDSETAQN